MGTYYHFHDCEIFIVEPFMIAKHRNGPVGIAPLLFNPQLTRFFNLEDEFEHKIIAEYKKSESGNQSEDEEED